MSDERRTKLREALHVPKIKMDVRSDASDASDGPLRPEQSFLKRQAEVTQQDHEQFSQFLQEKSARDRQEAAKKAEKLAAKVAAKERSRPEDETSSETETGTAE